MTDDRKKHESDAAKSQYRRDKIKHATPSSISSEDRKLMTYMYKLAKQMSESTKTKYQVDHIIPLDAGGLNVPENLQIITEEQNKSKGNSITSLPIEGAILSHMIKDDMIRSRGKFVKGVSGNPSGRPKKKKVILEDDEGIKLTKLFIDSGGDAKVFRKSLFENNIDIKMPMQELLKVLQGIQQANILEQKADKEVEKVIKKVEIILTTNEEFDKIKKMYLNMEEESNE